ncbi:MAG: hypothetical protein NWE92_13095 [Candidatus Bathyarchaeota archaeon]|nr:hypothetical protein [Candidatus Bathyarchaeota archaeon]
MESSNASKISDFLKLPGYRIQYRQVIYTVQKIKELPETEKNQTFKIIKNYVLESEFLQKRELDFGFYRYVKKRMMLRKDWFNNQIREIGYLVLLDLLHPEKATPTNSANKKLKNASPIAFTEKWLDDRQLERIRANYPEIFFTPQRVIVKGRGKRNNRRERRYSTTFSDMTEITEADRRIAWEFLEPIIAIKLPYAPMVREIQQFNAPLRLIDPDDILAVQRFSEYLKVFEDIIVKKFGLPTRNEWLVDNIKQRTRVVEGIFQLVECAVALRWYRTIKSEDKKKRLLKEKHPLKFTRQDAEVAVKENFKWISDPITIADYVFRASESLEKMGEYKAQLYLFEACLKLPLLPYDRGLCYHNIAWVYRLMKIPRKFLSNLQTALATFEGMKSAFDIAITWAFIGEAYQLLNNQTKSSEAIEKAQLLMAQPQLDDYQKVQAYEFLSDCFARMEKPTLEKNAVICGLKAAARMEQDPGYGLYFNQYLQLIEDGVIRLPEAAEELTKLRPPHFKWHKEEPNTYIPISPSEK